jgi:hypothetical protein
MALDPNIPLQSRGIALKTYGESLGQAQQQRANALTLQAAELQAESAERALQEEQQLRGLFGSGQPIEERAVFGIVGPKRGADIMKGLASLREQEVKTARELYAHIGSVLGGIKATPEGLQPEAYATARAEFIRKGWIKPEEVPEQFDPAFLVRAQQQAMTAEQQAQDADRVADNERADKEYNDKRPGVLAGNEKAASEALDAQLVTEGRLLGAATNNAEWKAALAQLPPERAKLYPVLFSKGIQAQVNRAARTAEERIQQAIQQQNANSQSASAGEQARHNRVMESRQSEPLEAIVGPDGQPVYVPRSQAVGKTPATNRERPSEAERKAAGFYGQMRDALTTIDQLEGKITENELQLLTSLPHEGVMGRINRNELSENAKRYYRALMQFTEARLRPVSGAAIAASEYETDRMTYFKQYGETPNLAEDRKRARSGALSNLRANAGVLAPKDDAPDVPQGVAQLLQGKPDGTYRMNDGSAWIVEGGKARKGQ